ncbi:hypothetical protein F5X96DRAFT_630132 [Biscogniauxia mediterranea]|nr:hypothetical protein F5X96DRAFT_630132 [Biscogniauxia mediterranea]
MEELPQPICHFYGLPLLARELFDDPNAHVTTRILTVGFSWHFDRATVRRAGDPPTYWFLTAWAFQFTFE